MYLYALNFTLMLLLSLGDISSAARVKEFHKIYAEGVDAYLEDRWGDCIAYITNAVDIYFEMRSLITKCKRKCRPKVPETLTFNYSDYDENIVYHEQLVKEALCVVKCKYDVMSGYAEPSKTPMNIEYDFENRIPYDYLQICYHKLGDTTKAVEYAYSFLIHNPKHEVMMNNLAFYLSQENILQSHQKDIEAQGYERSYLDGLEHYEEKNYQMAAKKIKKAMSLYLEQSVNCRLLCEGPYKPIDNRPDYILAIADHYIHSLKCKQKCFRGRVSTGFEELELFPGIFNYLQYSYFQLKKFDDACQAVATYMLFHPDSEFMSKNKVFYFEREYCNKENFVPYQEIDKYVKRDLKEKKLMKSIDEWTPYDSDVKEEIVSRKPSKELQEWTNEQGIELKMQESELNGTERYLADGFANEEQCAELIQLAEEKSVEGDGYEQKSLTAKEKFAAIGLDRFETLLKTESIEHKKVQMLLDLSEKARAYTEKYFNLDSLYFDFTHLVCRTSLSDVDRMDLSHAIHSDNCIVQKNGTCIKQSPAYIWRDYSAVLYLNDDFEGGEFFFSDKEFKTQSSVKPKCGRVVGFAAGNYHGVRAVVKGQRCCLAMWYTLDPTHEEMARPRIYNQIRNFVRNRLKEL